MCVRSWDCARRVVSVLAGWRVCARVWEAGWGVRALGGEGAHGVGTACAGGECAHGVGRERDGMRSVLARWGVCARVGYCVRQVESERAVW